VEKFNTVPFMAFWGNKIIKKSITKLNYKIGGAGRKWLDQVTLS
jgi:hypothetical protein